MLIFGHNIHPNSAPSSTHPRYLTPALDLVIDQRAGSSQGVVQVHHPAIKKYVGDFAIDVKDKCEAEQVSAVSAASLPATCKLCKQMGLVWGW